MNKTDLDQVLKNHAAWLADAKGGERADLTGANLYRSDLTGANLTGANLYRSDLTGANLTGANLTWANLYRSDLTGANLTGANLYRSDLTGANLTGANLTWANVEFAKFPSPRLLSSIQLGELPDELTAELMRRDAYAHPQPERFDTWAEGGNCPYRNEERAWFFEEKRHLWQPGNPTMTDRDLIVAICRAKGWKIAGVEL